MPKDKMTQAEADRVIHSHSLWLKDNKAGWRANFFDKDLSGLNFEAVDLSFADLSFANLSDANLSFAYLCDADLSNADLSDTIFSYADLNRVNFSFTNLRDANLRGADLKGANLVGAIFSADKYISISNTYFCDPSDIGYPPKPIIKERGRLSNGELIKSVVTSPKGDFVTCQSGNVYLMNETGIQNANLRIV